MIKRGEIYWVNFGPSLGSEIQKTRPAIVVSSNIANEFLQRVQVVPLTSNTKKVYASEALVTISGKLNKAMADQIQTTDKIRLQNKIGKISDQEMFQVDRVMKIQLGLN